MNNLSACNIFEEQAVENIPPLTPVEFGYSYIVSFGDVPLNRVSFSESYSRTGNYFCIVGPKIGCKFFKIDSVTSL